jgi:GT2 family glycosyltransferase
LSQRSTDPQVKPPFAPDKLEHAPQQHESLHAEIAKLKRELATARGEHDALRRSLSWRITAPLRRAADIFLWAAGRSTRIAPRPSSTGNLPLSDVNYERWTAMFGDLSDSGRRAIGACIEALPQRPLISLIMAVRDTPAPVLRQAIASVQSQIYPHWQLCIVDNASTAPHMARLLAYGGEPRIRIVRRGEPDGVVAALQDALAMAEGSFLAFLDPEDRLAETALFQIAYELACRPDTEILYSDEDWMDSEGRRFSPRFKTGWNPDLLLAEDYIGRLAVYSRALFLRAGGLRQDYEGAHEHDLALRAGAAASPSCIRHIPAVLCHRAGEPPARPEATDRASQSRRAVQDLILSSGATATVSPAPGAPLCHRVAWHLSTLPLVSIIVPTRDRADLLEQCADGLLHHTDYPSIEVIVADNGSEQPRTKQLFERLETTAQVRILPFDGPFNWSAVNNRAAQEARGEVLVFLNNDIQVTQPGWLLEMASHAMRPETGAVGAKLVFPDGSIQHAGVWLVPVGARHYFHLAGRGESGYLNQLILTRNLSAVTGACMAIRRALFCELGGFDTSLQVSYSDIDLCVRLVEAGYRIVWTPYAELIHLESASRGSNEWRLENEERERLLFVQRWAGRVACDPFLNPNLGPIGEEQLGLAFPPGREEPWLAGQLPQALVD